MGVSTFVREARLRPVVKGLLTRIPGMQNMLPARGTGGTNEAEYCYGVWLKHLTHLWENGVRSIPSTLAELGPRNRLSLLGSDLCVDVDRAFTTTEKFENELRVWQDSGESTVKTPAADSFALFLQEVVERIQTRDLETLREDLLDDAFVLDRMRRSAGGR